MSSRRARYADDTYGSDEDPRAPRSGEMRSKRQSTPPAAYESDSPSSRRPPKKSILVDPNEDPKDKAARRPSRSNSQVRIRPPPSAYQSSDDDGTVAGRYVKHRNGEMEYTSHGRNGEPRRRTHDLEKKTGDGNRSFQDKRDGYESEEGEQLKKGRRPDRGDNIGDVDDSDGAYARPKRSGRGDRAVALPDRTRHNGGSGAWEDDRPARRQRDSGRRRLDSDYDDDRSPPQRARPRRPDHDRGYDSEGARRRRRDWDDDRDDRGPPRSNRRSVRYDDEYPPPRRPAPREDRLRPPPPRGSRYDDDDLYDRRGRDRYDEKPIRRARSDARARDRDPDRRRADKKNEWAKAAGAIFMSQAMPVIKREGGKFARRELENFLANQRR